MSSDASPHHSVPVRPQDEGVPIHPLPELECAQQHAADAPELQHWHGDSPGWSGASESGDARARTRSDQRHSLESSERVGRGDRRHAPRIRRLGHLCVRDDMHQHPIVHPALQTAAGRGAGARELQRGCQLPHLPRTRDAVDLLCQKAPGRSRGIDSEAHSRPSHRRGDGGPVLGLQP